MPLHRVLALLLLVTVPSLFVAIAWAHPHHGPDGLELSSKEHALGVNGDYDGAHSHPHSHSPAAPAIPRSYILLVNLTVFVLAIFIGFEVIAKVPPTLHTPLMSGSNAISGITVVGAIITAGFERLDFATWLGFIAVILANVNAVGGFVVTHRMLLMFKRR